MKCLYESKICAEARGYHKTTVMYVIMGTNIHNYKGNSFHGCAENKREGVSPTYQKQRVHANKTLNERLPTRKKQNKTKKFKKREKMTLTTGLWVNEKKVFFENPLVNGCHSCKYGVKVHTACTF